MRGAAGDDTLVWNNGDGSDLMDGQDGLDRIEVNGAAGAGDAFTIAPNGGRARFDRTNLGPFTLDIGSSELLDVRGQGGDDALLARDGIGDLVRGGIGTDSAQVDLVDAVDGVDGVDGVESVDRRAAADTTATPVDVVSRRARLKGRRVKIALECPAAGAGGCEGTLTLLSARRFKVAGSRVRIVLGSSEFDLDAGERQRIRVRVPRKLVKRVIAQTSSTDAAGNLAQASERVRLRR